MAPSFSEFSEIYPIYEALRPIFAEADGKEVQVVRLSANRVEALRSDKVLTEIRDAVEAMGLRLRVQVQPQRYSAHKGSRDDNRVNAFLYKDHDGKHKISYSFSMY